MSALADQPQLPGLWDDGWELLPDIASRTSKRKHRHGSLPDLLSRRSLPAGPASVQELFNYPVDIVRVLFQDAERAQRCKRLLKDGIVEHSDYSGIGAERECKRLLLQVLNEDCCFRMDYVYRKSCDIDPRCREVLTHMSHALDEGESCVFCDITHQLVKEGQDWCAASDPSDPDQQGSCDRSP